MRNKKVEYRFDLSDQNTGSSPVSHFQHQSARAAGFAEFSGTLNSLYSLHLVHRIWNICLVSVPLDLLILNADIHSLGIQDMEHSLFVATMTLLCLSFLTCRREKNMVLLRRVKESYIRMPDKFISSLYLLALIFGIALLFFAGDAIAEGHILSAVLPLVLYGSAIYSIIKTAKNGMPASTRKSVSLNSFEQEILILNALPLVVARTLSVSAALYAMHSPNPVMSYLPYFILCLLLLFEGFPEESLFLTGCKGCGRKIPRSQLSNGLCTVCILRRRHSVSYSRGASRKGAPKRKSGQMQRSLELSVPPAIRQLLQKRQSK